MEMSAHRSKRDDLSEVIAGCEDLTQELDWYSEQLEIHSFALEILAKTAMFCCR